MLTNVWGFFSLLRFCGQARHLSYFCLLGSWIPLHRNRDGIEFLVDDHVNITSNDLVKMQEILTKIDNWWIREVELATHPDFVQLDREELETLAVHSGPMLIVDHLLALLKTVDIAKPQ